MQNKIERRLNGGHRALNLFIEREFDGNKLEASRDALELGFPAKGEGEKKADLVHQTIVKLSNGRVQVPSFERILWFQHNWGIDVESWRT